MPSPEQEQTQDLDNEQDMYDTQESVEDEEEGNQELPNFLPMPCVTLIKEYQDLLAKADRESCLEETQGHLKEAEPNVEEEAQRNIQPPNQLTQEKEDCYFSIRNGSEAPFLTEEEIDQILNQQTTPEVFYRTHSLAHSSYEFDDSVS